MTLEKEAQRKSIVNMLGRHLNPMELARHMISRRYTEVYNKIKEVDTNMREIALASDPGIRDSLHEARMAYKNREYPKVVYYAWKLLESVDGIFYQINELEQIRDMVLEEFQGEGSKLTDEERHQMYEALGKKTEKPLAQGPVKMPQASNLKHLLYTTAAPDLEVIGIMKRADSIQWLKENIPTFHQMEGALLDKIFRNKMGKQREAAKRALNIAEKIYNSINEVFKQLDAARTDFSSYITIAKKFKDKFEQYKQELSTLYQTQFSDIVPDVSNKTDQPIETQPVQTPVTITEKKPVIPPPPPIETQEQKSSNNPEAELEFEESGPPTLTSAQMEEFRSNLNKPAAQVVNLWKRAKFEANRGNRGISAALLVKASEICDDNNDVIDAKRLIQAAEKVLKG